MFFPKKKGMAMYEELIFHTNKNKANDPRIKRFLTALQQGINYLIQHPKQSWERFAKNHPELNNSLNHSIWFATIPYFTKHPALLNKM